MSFFYAKGIGIGEERMKSYIFEGTAVFLHSILLGIILFAIYEFILIRMKKRKRSDYGNENRVQLLFELLLTIYICTILQITGIIGRVYTWNFSSDALKNLAAIPFQGASIRMITLNCLLFVPYGFLAAFLKRKICTSWWKLTFAGFITSFVIEFIQAFTGRLPEVDDLIANTVGFFMGVVIAHGMLELKNKISRRRGLIKIVLTIGMLGISLYALSFWANGDQLQEKEDRYYEKYSFNTERFSQLSNLTIWENAIGKRIANETDEAYDWYSWIGNDISNNAAHYKIKKVQSDIKSVMEKNKMYVEMEYKEPQSFKFYNNTSWEINRVRCVLFCVNDGTLWYGTENGKLEKFAEYKDKESVYEEDTQLLDELNEWMTNQK